MDCRKISKQVQSAFPDPGLDNEEFRGNGKDLSACIDMADRVVGECNKEAR